MFPTISLARLGVGVGTGKIEVQDKLKPGMIYKLPELTVLNTGDEPADYETSVSYHEKQPQLMPAKDWFIFSPQKFHLEPNGVQVVEVKINLPFKATPGDYFAYLEGHPIQKTEAGNTSIGVAAASKLYFTVVPANIFQGVYYKVISAWKIYSPWSERLSFFTVGIVTLLTFKRFFNVQINVKKTKTNEKDNQE